MSDIGTATGLGLRRGKVKPRPGDVAAIVIHTTGAGPLARFAREGAKRGDATPFNTAVRIYTTIMDASPHYVVGQAGECTIVVPETHAAWHVGASKSAVYHHPKAQWMTSALSWWGERWPSLGSPRDLAGGNLWRDGSCNSNSIGIEVVPPIEGARHAWSPDCWRRLASLVMGIAERHSIPIDREYIVTHSDAHPISRTAKGAPWDPSESQFTWDRMREALASGA